MKHAEHEREYLTNLFPLRKKKKKRRTHCPLDVDLSRIGAIYGLSRVDLVWSSRVRLSTEVLVIQQVVLNAKIQIQISLLFILESEHSNPEP